MNIQILGPQNRNNRIISKISERHKIFITENEIDLVSLESNQINFIISNGYAPIIKKDIIDAYQKKIINLHPASLPNGRGIYPNFWSFFEKYPQEATIHYIDYGIDTGDIIINESLVFSENETLRSSLKKLMYLAEELLLLNFEELISDFGTIFFSRQ